MSASRTLTEKEWKVILPLLGAAVVNPPKDGSTASSDETIAYHEAGHALTGLSLGRRLNFVTLDPPHCDFAEPSGNVREQAQIVALTAMGGPIAENQVFGVSLGFPDDIDRIREAIAPHLGIRREIDVFQTLGEDVRKVLKLNRGRLDALATALARRRRLSGADADAILRNVRS